MKTQSLHFRVDFDGMTDRVREFWAEGRYEYTYNLLIQGFNLSREQAAAVLNGHKRLAQDPDGEEGCQGILVDDTWRPKDLGFAFYPDASSPATAAECQRLFKENQELHEQLESIGNCDSKLERALPSTVVGFIARERELDERPTPRPTTSYKSDNGWVLPNGKFYPCKNFMEHIWLADRLGKTEQGAEESGWVKIATPMLGVYVVSDKAPTQKQIDTVFAWANASKDKRRLEAYKSWMETWNLREV